MPQQKRPAPSSTSKTAAANDQAGGQNWKRRKQERAHTARFIETQTGSTAASSASSSRAASKASTPVPGHSTPGGSGLPTSIELESLVSSRAFQIQSFLRSIKSAKSATTTRAWQLLPRHARRRAASHNLLRLPSRLRSKAFAELRSSTTQARSRSDIRKRLPSHGVVRATLRRSKLAERASHPHRRWLETHLWHAKRFRMTTEKGKGKERDQGNQSNRWGFVLPETTMMKSHRASWRSANEFVTVHDASYTSVFRVGVANPERGMPTATDMDTELRLLDELHNRLKYAGFVLRTPADLASTETSTSHMVIDTSLVGKGPDRGRSNAIVSPGFDAALAPVRVVIPAGTRRFVKPSLEQTAYTYTCREALIFVHPAAALLVRRALKAAKFSMHDEQKSTSSHPDMEARLPKFDYAFQLASAPDPWLAAGGKDSSLSKLEHKRRRQAFQRGVGEDKSTLIQSDMLAERGKPLDDKTKLMREQGYNIFEIIGPRAASLLQSVLKVHHGSAHDTDEYELRQLLAGSSNSGPAMIDIHVDDPRLSYPPKLKPSSTHIGTKPTTSQSTSPKREELLWDGASAPRFSKGEIDSRRALNAIPGARLIPDSRDDVIPVVIIRDRLVQKPQMDRYTLIVPRGWGTAFFLSLVATHQSGASSGARVLGQHQLKHQRLELAALASSNGAQKGGAEADLLSYPHNWLGTQAYAVSEKEAAMARQEEWSRRPKGKRTEYMFPSHKHWRAYSQDRTAEEVTTKLARDRTGVARPYPFGGSHQWEWIVSNSTRLYGKADAEKDKAKLDTPWLVAQPDLAVTKISSTESALPASYLASAMVAVKLQAVRKGTVSALSSLLLPATFEDQLTWVQHLDSTDHAALVTNRASNGAAKMDKQHLKALVDRRCEIMQLGRSAPCTAPGPNRKHAVRAGDVWSQYAANAVDPEELHDRSADWNNAVGTVLDGDYSLGNGRGFGIGAITLHAWAEVLERQRRIAATQVAEDKGRRRPRNPIDTNNLLLMREPGSDVVRAVSATVIPLLESM